MRAIRGQRGNKRQITWALQAVVGVGFYSDEKPLEGSEQRSDRLTMTSYF